GDAAGRGLDVRAVRGLALLDGQGGELTGRASGHAPVDASGDDVVDLPANAVDVDGGAVCGERGDDGGEHAAELLSGHLSSFRGRLSLRVGWWGGGGAVVAGGPRASDRLAWVAGHRVETQACRGGALRGGLSEAVR